MRFSHDKRACEVGLLRVFLVPPFVFLFFFLFSFIGCSSEPEVTKTVPTVKVAQPVVRLVTERDDFAGRLESPQYVRLVARVSGLIEQAPFREGSIVEKGDTLFLIDPRPFQAELASKMAELSRAQAGLTQAKLRFDRYEKIRESSAISAQDYDQAVAALQQAQASVAAGQAAVDLAKLNVGWTKVTAPLRGRVSRRLVTEGNFVNGGSGGSATELTTITSIDPVFAYVDVPERAFLKYQELATNRHQKESLSDAQPSEKEPQGGPEREPKKQVPCAIQRESEKNFPHTGVVDFVDNQINPATGTINLRCSVPNPSGELTPGAFVRVRIPGSAPYEALLIPDAALGTDQNSRFVLRVGEGNKIESRTVEVGSLFGKLRAITKGLEPSDLIVISGLQVARPGTVVNPQHEPIHE